jgi:FMN reductase
MPSVLLLSGSPSASSRSGALLEYALKPVLSALGATDLLQGVYVVDTQLKLDADGQLHFTDDELRLRFTNAVAQLTGIVAQPSPIV